MNQPAICGMNNSLILSSVSVVTQRTCLYYLKKSWHMPAGALIKQANKIKEEEHCLGGQMTHFKNKKLGLEEVNGCLSDSARSGDTRNAS